MGSGRGRRLNRKNHQNKCLPMHQMVNYSRFRLKSIKRLLFIYFSKWMYRNKNKQWKMNKTFQTEQTLCIFVFIKANLNKRETISYIHPLDGIDFQIIHWTFVHKWYGRYSFRLIIYIYHRWTEWLCLPFCFPSHISQFHNKSRMWTHIMIHSFPGVRSLACLNLPIWYSQQ